MKHALESKNPESAAPVGYVEVAAEPLHKEIHADSYFRAYQANLAPGQATVYHRHSEDTLYLVIKGGRMSTRNFKGCKRGPMLFPRSFPLYKKLWLALQNLFAGSAYLPTGLSFFMPSRKHPSIHLAAASPHNREAVWLIGIELRQGAASRPEPVHEPVPGRVEYDDNSFKVFVCAVAAETSARIALPGYQLFMVCTKGLLEIRPETSHQGKNEPGQLTTGAYRSISGDIPLLASNPGNTASELTLLAVPANSYFTTSIPSPSTASPICQTG